MQAYPQAEPGDATVGALIERVATERPQATFLIDPETEQTMTFAELRERVAATAAHLQGLNLMHGDRVCVVMDNGPAAVASHLAVMGGGFVAVPLDPGSGRSQLADLIRHCGARAILVAGERGAQVESIAAELDPRIARIDVGATPFAEVGGGGPARLPDAAHADDDALLMYTSGSTGRPKGVLVSQAGVMARVVNNLRAHELNADDRLLCALPLYHMSALIIMLGVLASGSSLVMPPRFSVARYWDWVVRYRCTWLGVVPTIVAQLLRRSETHGAPPPDDLRLVRFARCSSAPLSDTAHRAFEERFGIVLVQGMGMTEAGGIFLNPPHRALRKIGALGHTCGLAVKLVGRDGDELDNGQIGELLVRGPGVMRGYFKDPEATASALDAAGWLRTGDLAYRDDDGYFFHAGRAKELIIKAGTNIAPREVDEALASHPDVAQAAAVGVADPNLGEDIGAFVLLRDGACCSERALLDHCEAHLGEFKTPSWIAFVDALPTGPSGKIQRAQLARRAGAVARRLHVDAQPPTPFAEPGFVAPRTAVERAVAAVWADVLGREDLGIHDDFFALGGTSLLALRITTRLRQSLDVQLSLGALLDAPTIAAQATLVAERQRRAAAGNAPAAQPGAGDAGWATATLLAPVDEADTGIPLFCVYDISRFRRLAQQLGPRHPVYGIAIGPAITAINSTQPTATFSTLSVAELARVCLPEIRRIQPHGPYQIGGFSFGGRVALEVAQQLRAAGEDVRLLVIFDTFMPGAFRRRPLRWFTLHLARLLRAGPRYLRAAARRHRGYPDDSAQAPDESDSMAFLARREGAFRRHVGARYRPRPFSGRVVLFRATANALAPHYRATPLLGWEHIARGQVSVHDIPGAHLEILDERRTPLVTEALRPYLGI